MRDHAMTNEEALRVLIQGANNSANLLSQKASLYHGQFIRQWLEIGWRMTAVLNDPVIQQRMRELDEELREKAQLRYNNALRRSMAEARPTETSTN
jgi:hypothetical protein